MRNAGTLGLRRLRGADVEPPVDLPRVGTDDLGAGPLGELERERALADRGRPDDRDHAQHAHRPNIRSICPRVNSAETGRPCGQLLP